MIIWQQSAQEEYTIMVQQKVSDLTVDELRAIIREAVIETLCMTSRKIQMKAWNCAKTSH